MPQTDVNLAFEAPRGRYAQFSAPAVSGGADLNSDFHRVGNDGAVDAVTYTPAATITGAATNNRTLSLVNLGAAGTGTAVIATLNFANTINAPAHVEKTIVLSATAAALLVASGDILQWQSTHVGTGFADPGGLAIITLGDV